MHVKVNVQVEVEVQVKVNVNVKVQGNVKVKVNVDEEVCKGIVYRGPLSFCGACSNAFLACPGKRYGKRKNDTLTLK